MAYANWYEYNTEYLMGRTPSISETDFPYWERRARAYIDKITSDRLHDADTLAQHREIVVQCVCELAEHYASDIVRESAGLSSVSVTGHSMSFDKTSLATKEKSIAAQYLANTGLLFRGVG